MSIAKIVEYWDVASVVVCFAMYATTCAIRCWKSDYPMAITFGAYALANLGFVWQFANSK